MKLTLAEILNLIPGSTVQNASHPERVVVTGVSSFEKATPTDLVFVGNKASIAKAKELKVAVVMTSPEFQQEFSTPTLVVKNVEKSIIPLLNYFHPPQKPNGVVSSFASIHPSAKIGENTNIGDFVSIGAYAVVGKNSIIENGVSIAENVSIGEDARIGANSVFHHGVKVGDRFVCFGNCTIGGDGFKFIEDQGKMVKVPQVATVIIGNDVELGAGCCIDRGGLVDTEIGDGTKFDNMVHIGHNCKIGKHVVIAGQTGIAGSTTIGNYVMISGQCAFSDHLTIADKTKFGGKTGIRTDITEPGGVYAGELGLSFMDFQKFRANIKHIVSLSKWIKRIEDIEIKIKN